MFFLFILFCNDYFHEFQTLRLSQKSQAVFLAFGTLTFRSDLSKAVSAALASYVVDFDSIFNYWFCCFDLVDLFCRENTHTFPLPWRWHLKKCIFWATGLKLKWASHMMQKNSPLSMLLGFVLLRKSKQSVYLFI